MKTNAVVLIVSAGVGAALVGVGACSSMMGNKAKKVVIEDGRIFIPGTSVSQADQDSVMAILGNIRDRFTKFRLTRTAILPANRTALLRTKSSVKRPSRRLRAMPNKTLFPDGESKSVVLLHRIRLSPARHLSPVAVHRILRRCDGGHPVAASHPQRPRNEDEETSREMVAKIAPILRKYSE